MDHLINFLAIGHPDNKFRLATETFLNFYVHLHLLLICETFALVHATHLSQAVHFYISDTDQMLLTFLPHPAYFISIFSKNAPYKIAPPKNMDCLHQNRIYFPYNLTSQFLHY